MSETSTSSDSTTDVGPHPLDSLHRLLVEIVARLPWHSEGQASAMLDLVRESETALKGDTTSESVVPAAAVVAAPPVVAQGGQPIDYDKLGAAIAKAQAAQASAAVEANPGWTPPGAVSAPPTETHAAVVVE